MQRLNLTLRHLQPHIALFGFSGRGEVVGAGVVVGRRRGGECKGNAEKRARVRHRVHM